MVNCQWTLKVLLYQYENKYNVEINENGLFCCCDAGMCVKELVDLPANCSDRCDTSFNLTIAPCKASNGSACFAESTESGVTSNSPSIVQYGYFFHFASNERPENVRACKLSTLRGINAQHRSNEQNWPFSTSITLWMDLCVSHLNHCSCRSRCLK